MTSSSEKTFAEATCVKAVSSHTYSADFPDDWCIGSVPHGGFVTSVFFKVASAHFSSTLSSQSQPHTIALHLDFLRRTQVGPALFAVKDTKLGRQASVIHITLSQDGRDEVVGYLTNSDMLSESGVTFTTHYSLNPAPLPVDLKLLKVDKDSNWGRQLEMPFASFRKATRKAVFYFPKIGQRKNGSADEWIRLASGEKWTNASLGYVADMWPMPVETFVNSSNPYDVKPQKERKRPAAKFWYPTLLLNLEVKKALPDEGVEWLFTRVEAKQIRNGRMDLDVVILDEGGDIVALSQHVAFVLGSDRNLAERSTGTKL